ncbi:MAG TPA: hypothetical protein VIH37_14040 [Candidatus Limnocylindrales bacterium]
MGALYGRRAAVAGVRALYLAFRPDQGELGDVAFFGFTRERPKIA